LSTKGAVLPGLAKQINIDLIVDSEVEESFQFDLILIRFIKQFEIV
jgi:hypothetical protein